MTPADAVRASFAEQAPTLERLGSPFMGRLMRLLAERLAPGTPISDKVLAWKGDPRAAADNVSLRLAGGLHALVISNTEPELASAYPPNDVSDDVLWSAIDSAFRRHSDTLSPWLDRPPQTNEVRRAAALIPALHLLARETGKPLAVWEVGCSAGLALRMDRFHLSAGSTSYGPGESAVRLRPDWTGAPPAPSRIEIVDRQGVDLSPLDPADPEHRLRLLSYLWPDQPDRRALTKAAISVALETPARIQKADALDWLARTLPTRREGVATLLFHTVAWQYLPPKARARGEAMIAAEGARATPDSPLARLSLEGDGEPQAALTLQVWPGGRCRHLGRADFHGRTVEWGSSKS
ncbi:hypothetical protein CLV78_102582 [Aliiruegeria haliotis]|uniref:DUF2332 family protein n=1 Tax=Aliiruegeria haliotis TaxID=1280846 RepID=A0A2T0RW57_9RHOB|nr:DUF2332 family protein [Aliiruegeria haliotis]PRY25404.1 hypothetical protein CLV78_102582 [Aliiruegeria haliotis]